MPTKPHLRPDDYNDADRFCIVLGLLGNDRIVQGLGIVLADSVVMSRDYTKLRVFDLADDLVLEVYREVRRFPADEKYGLQSQLRRAAVSVATNIVEGSVRRSEKSWVHYLETSLGSACEVRYLIGLARRLGILTDQEAGPLSTRYSELIAGLQSLISSMADGRRPTAEG